MILGIRQCAICTARSKLSSVVAILSQERTLHVVEPEFFCVRGGGVDVDRTCCPETAQKQERQQCYHVHWVKLRRRGPEVEKTN